MKTTGPLIPQFKADAASAIVANVAFAPPTVNVPAIGPQKRLSIVSFPWLPSATPFTALIYAIILVGVIGKLLPPIVIVSELKGATLVLTVTGA